MIVLDSIELENFRSVENATFNPGSGITSVVGVSGAGKSSFLIGLLWCLYGETPGGVKTANLIRRGADSARVTVRIHSDHQLRVVRDIHGSTTTVNVWVDEVKQSVVSVKEGTAFVTRMLGISADSMKASFVVQQGMIADLSDKTPAVRRRAVESVTGLDVMMNALQKARDAEKESRNLLDRLTPDEETTREDLEKRLASLNTKKKELEGAPRPRFELITKRRNLLLEERKNLTNLQTSYELQVSERERMSSQIRAAQSANPEAHLSQTKKQREALEELLNTSRSDLESLHTELGRLRGLLHPLQTQVTHAQQVEQPSHSVDEITKEQERITKEGTKLSNRLSVLLDKKKTTQATLDQVESLGVGECPTCHQDMTGPYLDTLKESLSSTIQSQTAEIESVQALVSECRGQYAQLNNLLRQWEQFNDWQKDADTLKQIKDLSARLDDVKNREATLAAQVSQYLESVDQLKGEEKKYQDLLILANTELPAITEEDQTVKISSVDEGLKQCDADEVEQNKMLDVWDQAQRQLATISGQVSTIVNVLKSLDVVDQTRKELGVRAEAKTLIDRYRNETLESLTPRMSAFMSQFVDSVTSGEITSIMLDKDFTPTVTLKNGTQKGYSMLSGGERSLIGLAMRLSLSGEEGGFLWLDEALSDQDPQRRKKSIQALRPLSEDRQIILISHDPRDNDLADTVVHLVKEDGISRIA